MGKSNKSKPKPVPTPKPPPPPPKEWQVEKLTGVRAQNGRLQSGKLVAYAVDPSGAVFDVCYCDLRAKDLDRKLSDV